MRLRPFKRAAFLLEKALQLGQISGRGMDCPNAAFMGLVQNGAVLWAYLGLRICDVDPGYCLYISDHHRF